jgi:hypothetical protein
VSDKWTVPCADAVGRQRGLTVRARGGGVVLGLPAAGVAVLPGAAPLAAVLRAAQIALCADAARGETAR